jgi:HEAT repeat protein
MATLEPSHPSPPSWEECMEILDQLPGLPLDERVAALERLVRNPSPGIRERALRVGSAVLSDDQLTAYLRNDSDAVLRNAGLEIFKLRGGRSFPVALKLLQDADPDVVLQAVLILDHVRDPRALEPLRGVLDHPDTNVVQAAILAIGRLGNARSIPDLLPFLTGDPWLQMASVQALGDLRAPAAIRPLTELLPDLLVGSMAAEAVARIGGAAAFRALAAHWMLYGEQLEAEAVLGLLAHVLEGLPKRPAPFEGLEDALVERLADGAADVRAAAARCLLALGPSIQDRAAVDVLAGSEQHGLLPAALALRPDLVAELLGRGGPARSWGFHLAARHPQAIPAEAFFAALADAADDPDLLRPVVRALTRLRHPSLGRELLAFYLRLPEDGRAALEVVLKLHAEDLRSELAERTDLDAVDRLVLAALLGAGAAEVADGLVALGSVERRRAISQLGDIKSVMRLLPWERWLDEEPDASLELAAEVASQSELRELLPSLRARAADRPLPALLRAFGELRDRDAVPLLLNVLRDRVDLRPLALESLGRIGGPEARAALATAAPTEGRLAYRALSHCATEEDCALFREAASHPDWYVRLASAEVLTRFVRPENLAPLARLAGDPVPAVAHRALAFLES